MKRKKETFGVGGVRAYKGWQEERLLMEQHEDGDRDYITNPKRGVLQADHWVEEVSVCSKRQARRHRGTCRRDCGRRHARKRARLVNQVT